MPALASSGDKPVLGRSVLDGLYTWLEEGILDPSIEGRGSLRTAASRGTTCTASSGD
jgi:hypothetical protein